MSSRRFRNANLGEPHRKGAEHAEERVFIRKFSELCALWSLCNGMSFSFPTALRRVRPVVAE
jgi:hypothetical protein